MNIRLGSAPDSWGVWFPSDPEQIPWERFLDEIALAGYQWTELGPFGYLPTDLATLRAELDRRGLKVTAAFAMGHLEDPGGLARPGKAGPRRGRAGRGPGRAIPRLDRRHLFRPLHRKAHQAQPPGRRPLEATDRSHPPDG